MQELVANANVVGVFRDKAFGKRRPDEWTLLVISSVERRAEENFVEAEFLDSLKKEKAKFTCFSSEAAFRVGDLISQRGDELSFLHPEKLIPTTIHAGSWISISQEGNDPSESVPAPRHPKPVKKPVRLNSKVEHSGRPRVVIANSERVHFQSKSVAMADFLARLRPITNKFAQEGTRKPADVATRLNFEKIRTASGAPWTPRLVYILLDRLFRKTTTKEQFPGRNKPRKAEATKKEKLGGEAAFSKERQRGTKGGNATPKKRGETYQVKQSFSHGRSKTVVVERK